MSEKKKTEVIKEVKEEVRQLTEEELEKVTGGTTKTPEFIAGKGLKEATK